MAVHRTTLSQSACREANVALALECLQYYSTSPPHNLSWPRCRQPLFLLFVCASICVALTTAHAAFSNPSVYNPRPEHTQTQSLFIAIRVTLSETGDAVRGRGLQTHVFLPSSSVRKSIGHRRIGGAWLPDGKGALQDMTQASKVVLTALCVLGATIPLTKM